MRPYQMKVHELISSEDKWCKNSLARDQRGDSCDPFSPDACKWCVGGAIRICYPHYVISSIITKIQGSIGEAMAKWNDDPETSFEELHNVLMKLDV